MNNKQMLLLSRILLLFSGCKIGERQLPSGMDPKDLPKACTFEDVFMRSLLKSNKEVFPEYYLFLEKL